MRFSVDHGTCARAHDGVAARASIDRGVSFLFDACLLTYVCFTIALFHDRLSVADILLRARMYGHSPASNARLESAAVAAAAPYVRDIAWGEQMHRHSPAGTLLGLLPPIKVMTLFVRRAATPTIPTYVCPSMPCRALASTRPVAHRWCSTHTRADRPIMDACATSLSLPPPRAVARCTNPLDGGMWMTFV